MNIQCIAEHSVDLDLLSGGICIDVGCRGFLFSEAMRDRGCEVHAFDIEDMIPPPGITFYNQAVLTDAKQVQYKNTKDLQAKHVCFDGEEGVPVRAVSMQGVYHALTMDKQIDVLKVDAEGSEYFIFSNPRLLPVPKQISVEFHMHCHRALHEQYYDKCMENLLKWYVPVKHELTEAHGAGWNFWDSLFLRKDLL